MRHFFTFIAICLLVCLDLAGGAARAAVPAGRDFSYYQVILEKKPFGEVAPAEAAQPQAALADVISKDLELKAIIDDGTEIRVGLLDKKSNKNFFMNVGENREGIQLVSVNYENEEAVLKKGAETAVIKLRPEKDKDKLAAAAPAGAPSLGAEPLPFPPPSPFTNAPAATGRRPFFSDLKRKASPFRPVGTNAMPFQARPLDSFFKITTGAFPQAQSSPFGPFQPTATGANQNPFQAFMPVASNVPNPFAPGPAPNPNLPADSKGVGIEQLFQNQPAGQTSVQFPDLPLPAEGAGPVEEIAQ